MNLFVGIGKILDAYENGRVLKFTLAIFNTNKGGRP